MSVPPSWRRYLGFPGRSEILHLYRLHSVDSRTLFSAELGSSLQRCAMQRCAMQRCAMHRLQVVLHHLNAQTVSARQLQVWSGTQQVSAGDVVVVHGRRTAITRGGRGGFKVRPWVWAPGRPGVGRVLALLLGSPRRRRWLRAGTVTALSLWSGKGESVCRDTSCTAGQGITAAALPAAGHHSRRTSLGRLDCGSPGCQAEPDPTGRHLRR